MLIVETMKRKSRRPADSKLIFCFPFPQERQHAACRLRLLVGLVPDPAAGSLLMRLIAAFVTRKLGIIPIAASGLVGYAIAPIASAATPCFSAPG
jgi:hypothetical protein